MKKLPQLPKKYSVYILRSDEREGERLFVDGLKSRFERRPNGQRNITITRPDKNVQWTAWPRDKSYFREKMPKRVFKLLKNPDLHWDPDSYFDWESEGTKKIDGRECIRFVGKLPHGGGKARQIYFIDLETKMYRRMITYDKLGKKALTIDYLDVVIGPQDPALFEIPKGYKRVN